MFKIISKPLFLSIPIIIFSAVAAFLFFSNSVFFPIPNSQAAGEINVYYSVGQNTNDHKTGSPTITISGGVATFSEPQTATNMGVGDQISYGFANATTTAYISAKVSSTTWNVITRIGGQPTATTTSAVLKISHAFASLNAAVGGATPGAANSLHLNSANLTVATGTNTILNIPCYYDTGADQTLTTVSGWTTGINNYIRVYTPTSTISEANQAQRHFGKWTDTAFNIQIAGNLALDIRSDYMRVDGLQIKLTDTSSTYVQGVYVRNNNTEISNNLIVGNLSGTAASGNGQAINATGLIIKIWNNIFYNWINGSNSLTSIGASGSSGGQSYVYNNTVVNSRICIDGGWSGYTTVKNNIAQGCVTSFYGGSWAAGSDYNVSNVSGAPGAHSKNSVSVVFLNSAGNDYHLASHDTVAKDAGTSLSADSGLPFSKDIDGDARPQGNIWDIGADEFVMVSPALSVQAASPINMTDATLNGTIADLGGSTTTIRGFNYGLTAAYGLVASTSGNYATGSFAQVVSDLTCDTLYHYRAFAINQVGTGISTDQTFTTDSCTPTVPDAPTNVLAVAGNAQATVSFSIPGNGGSPILSYTVYSLPADAAAVGTSSPVTITGLTNGTFYTFTAVANNAIGTSSLSDASSSVVPTTLPSVSIQAASSIATTSVTLNGTITATGGASSTGRGFYYGTSTLYGLATSSSGSFGVGAYSLSITGLMCSTTYHYQAYAINTSGIGTSSDQQFTTSACGNAAFYVDASRVSSGDGSLQNPWKLRGNINWTQVSTALNSSNVTIYFSSRATWDDNQALTFNSTGHAGAILTIDGSSKYNINPSDVAEWSVETNASNKAIFTNSGGTGGSIYINNNTSYITIRGFKLLNPTWGGINLGSNNPSYNISHINIDNVYIDSPVNGHGIYGGYLENDVHDIVIENSTILNTPTEGIYIGHYNYWQTNITGVIIQNNILIDIGSPAGVGSASINIKPGVYGAIVRNNMIYRTDTLTGSACGIFFVGDNGQIYNNTIHGITNVDTDVCGGHGIFLGADGDGAGNGHGISSALIYNNLIYGNDGAGIAVTATTNTVGADATGLRIYNNTIWGNTMNTLRGDISLSTGNSRTIQVVDFKNNIIGNYSGRSYIKTYSAFSQIVDADNNLYFMGSTTASWSYGGVSKTWEEWQGLSFDSNGVQNADPLFLDNLNGDYRLTALSPAKNIGISSLSSYFSTDILGVNRPQGSTWDIGAYEYSTSTPPNISNIATSTTQTTATITWTTDMNATSSVYYGLTSSYGSASSSDAYASSSPSHSITLHDLATSTTYHFQIASANIYGNRSTSSDLTFTTLAPTYTITASAGANGTVTPSGVTTKSYGDSQAYTIATSTAGYHVADILVDGVSVGTSSLTYTFTDIHANHTISATFSINHYTITSSVSGVNGTIDPEGATIVSYGDTPTYTIATSTAGYHVADILVDGVSVGTSTLPYVFSAVHADHTIVASFNINHYTITASAGANGTVTPSGATTKSYGDSQAYTIATSTAGYHVADILVDGSSVGTSSLTYTFINITANHTISATFSNGSTPTTYTIGGAISGLTGTVVLQNNGKDNLSRSANGSFTFATATTTGKAYSVSVLTQPTGQTCAVTSGSGTVSSANVASISITCADSTCATLSNALTYNAYPTCGAASCASGYSLSGSGASATCVVQSSGGGGGGGGSVDSTPPGIPANFVAISSSTVVILSWTNPTDSDFAGVKLYRKISTAPTSQTDTSASLLYQGKNTVFTDTSAKVIGQLYYYSLYSYDARPNYSLPRTISISPAASGGISTTTVPVIPPVVENPPTNQGSGNITSLIGATSAVVNQITAQEAQKLIAEAAFAPLTLAEIVIYKKIIALATKALVEATQFMLADFIHFGTPTTVILGAGERGGSIASFRSAFGRLPESELDWQDVVKIGNGRWTTQRSATVEAKAKISFKKIYLREPNMNQANDNAAVNVMAYGLRPAQRNLNSEKTAIKSFKYIFRKNPVSAEEWDVVRAIAYSGAKR